MPDELEGQIRVLLGNKSTFTVDPRALAQEVSKKKISAQDGHFAAGIAEAFSMETRRCVLGGSTGGTGWRRPHGLRRDRQKSGQRSMRS